VNWFDDFVQDLRYGVRGVPEESRINACGPYLRWRWASGGQQLADVSMLGNG